MRTIITVLIFGVLILKGYGQTSEKQHVFDETDTVYCGGLIDNAIRFTPSTNEINTADSLAEIHIKKNRKDYPWTQEISDYKSYYRQYVGYLNRNNEKIILINSFCRPSATWTKYIVSALGGGSCYFEIKINLNVKETFDFIVNAPR